MVPMSTASAKLGTLGESSSASVSAIADALRPCRGLAGSTLTASGLMGTSIADRQFDDASSLEQRPKDVRDFRQENRLG